MTSLWTFDHASGDNKKWISVQSELEDLVGEKKEIKLELMDDGKPRAMVFFDIDGTLAHLSIIHSKAIQELFPEEDPKELEETYFKGFKLGNSFREFDRMKGIYVDGKKEWKDPEFYFKNRFIPNQKEIDEPEHLAHNIADAILKEYGVIASRIADEIYKKTPEEFAKSNIQPIFILAKIYSQLGIPMVGFTANAKIFVDKLAKYLKLSDIFLDIATDETMAGGGKEIAIQYLIKKLESKGIHIPKDRLIFVGDSLRGDIGISIIAKNKNKEIYGKGILVLENKEALIQIKKEISQNMELKKLVDSIDIYGFVVKDVPIGPDGEPMVISSFQEKFLEKL
ncbi:MAG: HAD family hydrolase [Candidatus Paceibacterota bacterium]|jgi:phosphoglycolate phosphatase-like HAD superfamily hydrolase